jgi:hypothetical protein
MDGDEVTSDCGQGDTPYVSLLVSDSDYGGSVLPRRLVRLCSLGGDDVTSYSEQCDTPDTSGETAYEASTIHAYTTTIQLKRNSIYVKKRTTRDTMITLGCRR